jgi:hypothetical protein
MPLIPGKPVRTQLCIPILVEFLDLDHKTLLSMVVSGRKGLGKRKIYFVF